MMILKETVITQKAAQTLSKRGWSFNWELRASASAKKIALTIEDEIEGIVEFDRDTTSLLNNAYTLEIDPRNRGNSRRYEGIAGTLFAYVAQDAFIAGFDGFVAFISKTNLVEHYIKYYGAERIYGDKLVFREQASRKLIEEFLNRDEVYYE
ncbi:MAG: hypothetical protein LBN34_02515 [Clostridiales Family XIII bacterium]|jgi:hypothetical protein|nr:hypothetical protein [Clostridiales Family XIII bacterium]